MEVERKPNIDVEAHSPNTRSKIPFSNHVAGTYRFGEIQPHWCCEVENNDHLPLRFSHNVRSNNIGAPLMGDIRMKKASFQVPMEAILPLNWDKILTNPVSGDDVNASEANCVIEDFPTLLYNVLDAWMSNSDISGLDVTDPSTFAPAVTSALKLLVFSEYFLSAGSLFASLGIHLNSLYLDSNSKYQNFDLYFDGCISKFLDVLALGSDGSLPFVLAGSTKNVYSDRFFTSASRPFSADAVSLGYFLDFIRDDFNWFKTIFGSTTSASAVKAFIDEVVDHLNIVQVDYPLSLKRPLAYQLVCAHFFSNDKIDAVYSAELYRQVVYSAMKNYADNSTVQSFSPDDTFQMNGMPYRYDYLSGHNFKEMFLDVIASTDSADFSNLGDVCRLAFGFNRSLRFLDYFTGSKSNPLAVGDVNVAVNNGYVNAVDITRNIQRQRFFNFVNRVGRRFEEYVSKIGGRYVAPDWHNPIWLGETTDSIYGEETENTTVDPNSASAPSQSVISNLRSVANRMIFEADFDRPSVIIAVTYFDISRYYTHNIERQNFHIDRFDMFNKFMQFVGDQKVYRAELSGKDNISQVFGYALRHAEYKTRVNYAFGAFACGQLPAWQFIADDDTGALPANIGPDYIRSRPSELDAFFLSLTGYSRGTYYHFIIDNYCDCDDMVRPMAYAPEIL